jgi:hypothetical protein
LKVGVVGGKSVAKKSFFTGCASKRDAQCDTCVS